MYQSFIAFFLLVACLNTQGATKITIYGDDAYEPYSYSVNNNELRGIYPNILREIFKKMPEYQVELKPVPWNRALKALEQDKVFAIFPPYYRPSERPYIAKYSAPILTEEIILVGSEIDANNPKLKIFPENWQGKKIAMFLGTQDIGGPKFQNAIKDKLLTVIEEKGSDKNLLLVGLKKRDGYINDRLAIKYCLAKMIKEKTWPDEASMPVEITTINKENGYLAFSQNKNNQFPDRDKFITRFNEELKKIKKSGLIDKIVKEYTEDKL